MKLNKRMVASLALVAVLLAMLTAPVWGQSAATRFSRLIVNQTLTSVGTTTLTGAVTTGGDVTVGDDLTITGEIDANGDTTLTGATVGTFLTLDAAETITLTSGATLTPLGSYQPIAAAGNIGFGAIAAGAAGRVLVVENIVNATITLTDSATLRLGGNAALAQYDTLVLIYDGATWVQLSKTDN